MKILLLNQTFHSDLVSTAQHLSDLAVALVEQGHQATVITSRRGYDDPDNLFPARLANLPRQDAVLALTSLRSTLSLPNGERTVERGKWRERVSRLLSFETA